MGQEETDNKVNELSTVDGTFVDDVVDTLEIPNIENPDDREYENVEIVQEGGL